MFHPLSRKKICLTLAAAFDAKQCARLSQTDGLVAAQWVKAGKLPADDQAAFTGSSRAAADVEFGAHCVVSGDSQTARPNARNITLGAASLPSYFMTPYQPQLSTFDFNFDRDVAKTAQIGALNDATATDLSTFQARGGKMIVFEGVSDPVFSAVDLRDWYKQLLADTQNARDTVRLFNVPGMTHCGGGSALDNFDPLTALEQWHDSGKAPEAIIATGKAFPGKSQPLCAYPKVATYSHGDVNKAESFVCK